MSSHGNPKTELTHYRPYDFAKRALVKIFAHPYATVCDLYCGSAADAEIWDSAQIYHYIGIDVSSSGISEIREACERSSQRKNYSVEFLEADPCSKREGIYRKVLSYGAPKCQLPAYEFSNYVKLLIKVYPPRDGFLATSLGNLETEFPAKANHADLVSCLQHLQFCFETEDRARRLLHNVSSLLKPGGYFFGITPDSSTIWAKYQKNVEAYHNRSSSMKPNIVPNCIRSESYIITFEIEEEKFPLFGKKYQLKFATDIAAETHCLVHFPSLIRLAREAGLEYVEIQNLTEFYDDNRAQLTGMLVNSGPNLVDPRGRLLSRSFDVLSLYTTFIFQKPDPDITPPLTTPLLQDNNYNYNEGSGSVWEDDEIDATVRKKPKVSEQKGILGPGPADLRFSEAL